MKSRGRVRFSELKPEDSTVMLAPAVRKFSSSKPRHVAAKQGGEGGGLRYGDHCTTHCVPTAVPA